jgi:arginyl-tRNA synthetase
LNFRIDRARLAEDVNGEEIEAGSRHGHSLVGEVKNDEVDFSSPNIAKPKHVGHLRSTLIGAAFVRLHQAVGYCAVGINHLGDWGSQFGGLVVAIRRWRDEVDLEAQPVLSLLELYQRSRKAAKEDESFQEEARTAWRELESGEEGEVRELWRWVTTVSLAAFDRTCARLGVSHDFVRGESHYEALLEETVQRALDAGVTEVSEGALIVRLEAIDPALEATPCLLRQSDGTTLYATRDLAALFQRWEEFHFERALYVVGSEQRLHFRQLRATLNRLGVDWHERVEHVDFGLLLGKGRVKLASRQGEVLVLDDLLDEVVEEARRIIEEKNPGLADKQAVAEAVGIGAIVFNDLRRERIKDVLFDKAEILSFEGETGPYLQYTHARLASILRKAEEAGEGGAAADWGGLEEAAPILLRMGRSAEVIAAAAAAAEPALLAGHLLSLARDVNAWYAQSRVLGQEAGLTSARLNLVRSCKIVLRNGLEILGVHAPEEM